MKLNTYQKVAITTVAATIFLIFVGGLVRVSGSGLGCPDWPKCFGSWMPPTSVSDLPARFNASQFNIYKTWTEYLNRVVGVIIGGLITATFVLSFRYIKTKPSVLFSSAAAFVLVLFQGWLGGRVVETGLSEYLVTIHMILAMAIMTLLLYAVFKATSQMWTLRIESTTQKWLFSIAIILFVCTLAQIILGTEVRETIDLIKAVQPRENWIAAIGAIAEVHRSFAWTVLISAVVVFYVSRWKTNSHLLHKMAMWLLVVVILQIVLGVGLYYLQVPPVYQVLHLVFASILICIEFLMLMVTRPAFKQKEERALPKEAKIANN